MWRGNDDEFRMREDVFAQKMRSGRFLSSLDRTFAVSPLSPPQGGRKWIWEESMTFDDDKWFRGKAP